MAPWRPDGQAGQASVEHAAVTLLVAVAVGAAAFAAGALGATSRIADGVHRQFARAVCVVSGGAEACEADREPCLVRSDADHHGWSVQLGILKIGRGEDVVVEQLSDGTFRVTRTKDVEGGLSLTHGAKLDADLGGRRIAVGSEVEAAVIAHAGGGDSWTLRSGREVDALVRALKAGDDPDRAPESRSDERGWSVSLGGTLSRGTAAAQVTISAADAYGARVDRATGRRTVYVRPDRQVAGTLSIAAVEGRAAAATGELYGVTVDRSGTPVELSVVQTGSYGASVDLPAQVQPAAGLLGVKSPAVAREYAVETRLALTGDADRRLAASFIDQVLHPDVLHVGAPVDVSRALADRLARAGIANARVYALDQDGFAVDGRVGVRGVAIGAQVGFGEGRTARLLSATSRGPDGGWYRRDDCLAAGA